MLFSLESGENTTFIGGIPQELILCESSVSSKSDQFSPTEEFEREDYLSRLLSGQIASVVLISGHSGAGKTYLAAILEELGVEQAPRLITRPKRDSDAISDVTWDFNDPSHGIEKVFFAYSKHQGHYGFLKDPLSQSVLNGKHIAIIVGDVGKLAPIAEAIRNHLPALPIVSIRLETPEEILHYRLEHLRAEAFEGEAHRRLTANQRLERWETAQLPPLAKFNGLHRIQNFSEAERSLFHIQSEDTPVLTKEYVRALMERFIEIANNESRLIASSILEEHELNPNNKTVENIIEVLEGQVVKELGLLGVYPTIKGGVAVRAYLDTAQQEFGPYGLPTPVDLKAKISPLVPIERQVSPDIDWTMLSTVKHEEGHLEALRRITGASLSFENHEDKRVFHSYKASGKTVTSTGDVIELDCIGLSRIQPEGTAFTFQFEYTGQIDFYRRTLRLPNGGKAFLVPPELLIVEKLAAGRGANLGKNDLFDAVSLLITQPVSTHLIKNLIESQHFSPDYEKVSKAQLEEPSIGNVTQSLRSLGFKDPLFLALLTDRALTTHSHGAVPPEDVDKSSIYGQLPFIWTPDSLKKAALVDSLLTSLSLIQKDPLSALGEKGYQNLVAAFGSETVSECCNSLKQFLYYYAGFQLGRNDVYFRRGLKPSF